MKSRLPFHRRFAWALLGLGAYCAPSALALSLFDVIQMTEGGYEEAEIIRLMDVTGARFELDADGVKALKEAEVSQAIIHRLLDDGGVAPNEYSATDAQPLLALRQAGLPEASILRFVRHRNMCEALDDEAADELRDAGFTAAFFDGFADLVAECQRARLARAPVEPALPASAYVEDESAHDEPEHTAHTVIIREYPHWRDRYHPLHYERYPTWYPVYIYRDHRGYRGHRFRDRHRHDRRHRLDRDRRDRGDRDRRHRDDRHRDRPRRRAETETEHPTAVAAAEPRHEPWVTSRPAPLDGPPTRLLPAESTHAAAPPKPPRTPIPRAPHLPVPTPDAVDGPAPGALTLQPIMSGSPRGLSRSAVPTRGTAPAASERRGGANQAPATTLPARPQPTITRSQTPTPRVETAPTTSWRTTANPRVAPRPSLHATRSEPRRAPAARRSATPSPRPTSAPRAIGVGSRAAPPRATTRLPNMNALPTRPLAGASPRRPPAAISAPRHVPRAAIPRPVTAPRARPTPRPTPRAAPPRARPTPRAAPRAAPPRVAPPRRVVAPPKRNDAHSGR